LSVDDVLTEVPLGKPWLRGKVRDTYDLGDGRLLMVATDRISAFDVVMRQGIPDKGRVLTQVSAYWFDATAPILPNHLLEVVWPDTDLPEPHRAARPALAGRAMIVRRATRLNVECVVRGYLAGSGWTDYQRDGAIAGIRLPAGLRESERLSEPIFTPSTKAEVGHDQTITFEETAALVGAEVAAVLREKSIALYSFAAAHAAAHGILIADTKFEFGLLDGALILIDEALTPDSSRFWPADDYAPGRAQASFDKQPLRDWLAGTGWNKEPPPPDLPTEIVAATAERYRRAFRLLTGAELRR
jgi:phosphoribosylaminoimidazole-succinocarboxamide synthase